MARMRKVAVVVLGTAAAFSPSPSSSALLPTQIALRAAEAPEDAEPQNLEPHKCKGWSWVSYAELRALPAERLFVPLITLLGDPSLCSTSFSL